MKNISHSTFLILSLPILFLIAAAGWRVDVFQIEGPENRLIFQSPVSIGHRFTTRYIHSVELTPVEDEYKIAGGLLWVWEERVRSTNAGLPFDKPKYGRFINTGEWMIFQGGRMSWKEYYYRIGNKNIGQNQITLEPFGRRNFFELFAGERLVIRILKMPLIYAKFHRTDILEKAPMGVPPMEGGSR
ncbi:MAG: DUF1850 domain-containing protein [Synergistaceae bacterium]|nr:DUF1850 domain-containing protein [Synergistaceae bacterium]